MSIYDQDTDPSSPDAIRQTPEPPSRAGGSGAGGPPRPQSLRAATTDPGVGPPSPIGRASGVVVPPSNRRPFAVSEPTEGRVKDSVELLLEGMAGPRPDRTKTMPQTGGEAAAAYHAEHAVHAGRTAREEDRKVLVDTVRLPAAIEDESYELRTALEETYVRPDRQERRVVVAILAGLLVVMAIFAYLDRSPREAATTSPSPRQALLAAVPAPPPSVTVAEPPRPPPAAGQPRAEETMAAPAETAPAAPATVASRARSTARPKAGDVGEFKTNF